MYDFADIKDKWESCKTEYEQQYTACTEDWRFVHGEGQWDDAATHVRKGRPTLVLNQMLPYVNQVVNDIRQSNIAIRVSPVDDGADIETAEVFSGIIRNIERQSSANVAYATAAMNAVGAGIGWIQVTTDYASPISFDQEIRIERVLDFTSVYIDPASKELDGSDAEYAFIKRILSTSEFEAKYPDADPISFDEDYTLEDEICIVEYFSREYEKDKIYLIQLIDGSVNTITQEQMDSLEEAQGTPNEVVFEIIDERDTQIPYIKHCIYSGDEEPLEESDFPSKYIPIVPVIGNEVYIDDKREFHSLIRQARDAQKMYNYLESANAEAMALQPKAPFIGPKGSFNTYARKWANANTENYMFLEYDIVHDENGQRAEPPQRSPSIQGSAALMQSAQVARSNIRFAIGMPQANMGEAAGEISGIAVRNRQIEGDNATFHISANLAASITQLGRILIDMIPRLYTRPKIARILGEDGTEKNVPINQPYIKQGGEMVPAKGVVNYDGIYELGAGNYDVVADVGASYSSKRQEAADKLINLISARPEIADVSADLLFEALDVPMGKEIAARIRANMPAEMLGDDPMAEKLKMASQAMSQLQERLTMYEAALEEKQKNTEFDKSMKMQEMQMKNEELRLDAQKTQADIQKTMAEIEKMRAETTGFRMDAVSALGNAVQGIAAQVEDMGQAMNIMFDAFEGEEPEEVEGVDVVTEAPLEAAGMSEEDV